MNTKYDFYKSKNEYFIKLNMNTKYDFYKSKNEYFINDVSNIIDMEFLCYI